MCNGINFEVIKKLQEIGILKKHNGRAKILRFCEPFIINNLKKMSYDDVAQLLTKCLKENGIDTEILHSHLYSYVKKNDLDKQEEVEVIENNKAKGKGIFDNLIK